MDKEVLAKEIRATLSGFMREKFNVNMAMLIKDINYGTYTFLLAAYFLDILTPYDGTKLIAEYFYKKLSKDAFSMISRINIVNTLDPTLIFIYDRLTITNGIGSIKNSSFFNVCLDDVVIFESHR
ncbi:MAG: hypothetical protein K0S61_691 [Anaerocolumna sp.]|jgi:hypothetical protein|nr:hypothetical protein [Anaerocolumna sp.]